MSTATKIVMAVCLFLMATLSCTQNRIDVESGPVTVSFAVDNAAKTSVSEDGYSVEWEKTDKIALWAFNSSSAAVLENQIFKVYGLSGSTAVFSSKLTSAMPSGTYSYYAANPEPESISGTLARYTVPDVQDGKGSGIMVARPAVGEALTTLEEAENPLNLSMVQKLHLLKFYVPENTASILGGEPIEKIDASFTKNVTGQVDVNLFDNTEAPAFVGSGKSMLTLDLSSNPLEPSSGPDRNYAFATIVPTTFGTSDLLQCTIYTDTHIVMTKLLPLSGRTMAAGHATAVQLVPMMEKERCKLYIKLESNHIGEEIQTVTLTAPAGCKFSDDGGNVLTITPEKVGESYVIEYWDADAFRTLSGKTISIAMDSQHATITRSFTVENLSGKQSTTIGFSTGWLLNEDFSTVTSFSSNDEYATSSAGSKSAVSFLNGWSGARIGASAGQCIRIACRRETSARYDARVDSAPLNGVIKSGAKLLVEFDYGDNNKYGGIYVTPPDVGQYVYVGYHYSSSSYASGDKDGNFGDKFYTHNKDGSYSKTPNHAEYEITGASGSYIRIAIRTMIEDLAGANNTTDWLYIDNVKVTIIN